MARYVEGQFTPTTIFEAATRHHRLMVICTICQHWAVYDPHQLWWLFHRRGWSGIFSDAKKRFGCTQCRLPKGRRPRAAEIVLTDRAVTVNGLPFPDEREWKRALSRYR